MNEPFALASRAVYTLASVNNPQSPTRQPESKTPEVQALGGSSNKTLAEELRAYSKYSYMLATWASLREKMTQRRTSPSSTRRPKANVSAEERLGDEGMRAFLSDRRAGLSHAALAKKYGLAPSTVQRVLMAQGMTGFIEDRGADREMVWQLHSLGWSQRRIAQCVGCSPKTVRRWLANLTATPAARPSQ